MAAILGGATSGGPEFKINFTGGSLNANIQYAGQTIYSWGDGITPGLRAVLVGGAIYLILAAIVLGVLYFILGSVIKVGYARFKTISAPPEKIPSLRWNWGKEKFGGKSHGRILCLGRYHQEDCVVPSCGAERFHALSAA